MLQNTREKAIGRVWKVEKAKQSYKNRHKETEGEK